MTNTVVCQACSASIYHCLLVGQVYAGTPVTAEDMVPVSDDIPQPKLGDDMACPKCGEMYAVPVGEKEVVLMLEDGSYWPYPPPTR